MASVPEFIPFEEDNQYLVYSDGRIFSKKRNIFLKPCENNGYFRVSLSINGFRKDFLVHRLVASHFIVNDDPVNKNLVNHLNGNRTDNRASNLEWTDFQGNAQHAQDTGLYKRTNTEIIKCNEENEIVAEYKSSKEALEAFGTNCSLYYRALKEDIFIEDEEDGKYYSWKHKYPNVEDELPEDAKRIPGYDDYFATKDGKIWSSFCKRYLKPGLTAEGYHVVTISSGGRKKTHYVHRLIMLTYRGEIPDRNVIDHINGEKGDNRLENLRYVTYSENSQHAYDTGLSKGLGVLMVCPFKLEVLKRYSTRVEAAKDLRFTHHKIVEAISTKKLYMGYQWVNNEDEIIDLKEKVKKIFKEDDDTITIYESIMKASVDMKCRTISISKACREKSFFRGYHWSFRYVWGFDYRMKAEIPDDYEYEIVADEDLSGGEE